MNSRLLAVFAVVLLLGAVIAGYLGYKVSTSGGVSTPKAETSASPADGKGKVAVAIASRDILAGTEMKEQDFYLEYLRQSPPGSYAAIKPLVGIKPWIDIKAGTVVTTAHTQPGGQLARLIRADERAVAIGVDEVVGGGGYVAPGDYVDVLVFIPADKANDVPESAQVVLPALRVLSYGTRMSRGGESENDEKKKSDEGRAPRTAVLAVPEKFTTRLMLASNAGSLRLAVRSAEAGFGQRYESGQSAESIVNSEMRNLIALSSLSPGSGKKASLAAAVRSPDREPAVTIYRGKDIQRVMQ
ncbi:MAG: Flp pilus assembly protein CpaB [Pedobacter sp.]|nr:Flp pilus assembly protein CpaB [Pedobacter sp.]